MEFNGQFYVCLDCIMSEGDDIRFFRYPGNMLAHLLEHNFAGHKVPAEALRTLAMESKACPAEAMIRRGRDLEQL